MEVHRGTRNPASRGRSRRSRGSQAGASRPGRRLLLRRFRVPHGHRLRIPFPRHLPLVPPAADHGRTRGRDRGDTRRRGSPVLERFRPFPRCRRRACLCTALSAAGGQAHSVRVRSLHAWPHEADGRLRPCFLAAAQVRPRRVLPSEDRAPCRRGGRERACLPQRLRGGPLRRPHQGICPGAPGRTAGPGRTSGPLRRAGLRASGGRAVDRRFR